MNTQFNFDEINQGIQALDIDKYAPGGGQALTAQQAQQAQAAGFAESVCPVYKAIRPILQALVNLPILPGSWRKALEVFVTLMDSLCP